MTIILRVDDVGRIPGDTPEQGSDKNLEYFKQWRENIGLTGKPVIYGATPTWLSDVAKDWVSSLEPPERVAVHGWDHKRGADVDLDAMIEARKQLGNATSYIPPFNQFGPNTISSWSKAGGRFFFGGFPDEYRNLPQSISRINGLFYLPAIPKFYDKAPIVREAICNLTSRELTVATLHVPWDNLENLRGFGDQVSPHLVDLYDSHIHLGASLPNVKDNTAPHFLAYSWILKEISQQNDIGTVMDFGARYSKLPTFMGLQGFHVTVCDRDATELEKQKTISSSNGVSLDDCWVWDGEGESPERHFDAIVACWSIQHNPIEKIPTLVKNLVGKLRPKGHLFVVGSYTNKRSFHQTNRIDPQWVLNDEDYKKIVSQAGLQEKSRMHFWYEHNTPYGNYCSPEYKDVNALCLHLRKS